MIPWDVVTESYGDAVSDGRECEVAKKGRAARLGGVGSGGVGSGGAVPILRVASSFQGQENCHAGGLFPRHHRPADAKFALAATSSLHCPDGSPRSTRLGLSWALGMRLALVGAPIFFRSTFHFLRSPLTVCLNVVRGRRWTGRRGQRGGDRGCISTC